MKTIGIIGGSGFIGSHITKKFLDQNYHVKVSSTNIEEKSRYNHLYNLNNSDQLEIAPLDLREIETLAPFIKGCDILVHAGTPFLLDVENPKTELIEPTVKGTKKFLEVVKNINGLEKVVFIASVAAWNTSFPMSPNEYDSDHIFSENDTPYYNKEDHPYAQAKYFADQEVRKFLEKNESVDFEIVTLSPTFVIGNPLSNRQDSTSQGLLHLFKNNIAPNPLVEMLFESDVPFSMVDVRDVAEAVYQAVSTSGIHGKNYLIANETYKVSDISRMLNNKPPVLEVAYTYSNALAKKELGLKFMSAQETLNNWG